MYIANVSVDISVVVVVLLNTMLVVVEKQSANYRLDFESSFVDHQYHWRFLRDYHLMYVELIEVKSIIDNDLQMLENQPTKKLDIVDDFF